MPDMSTNTNVAIATKFNRCIEFTLPDGTIITAKVLGEKAPAAAQAKRLVSALTVTL